MRFQPDNSGESNPSYKGDKAGYGAIHAWVRRRKKKPEFCEKCHKTAPRDLANRSGKYLRDLSDWDYLCRKCHMDTDGRNDGLRKSGKSRKLLDKVCEFCDNVFHPDRDAAMFCSQSCYMKAGGSRRKR